METYCIAVERSQVVLINVEAENEEMAKDKAIDESLNMDWSCEEAEYDAQVIYDR